MSATLTTPEGLAPARPTWSPLCADCDAWSPLCDAVPCPDAIEDYPTPRPRPATPAPAAAPPLDPSRTSVALAEAMLADPATCRALGVSPVAHRRMH